MGVVSAGGIGAGGVLSGDSETPKMAEPSIANLMADSESGSPVSYSSFVVTIAFSRLVSEISSVTHRRTDRHTDNADHYYSWHPHCDWPA